jgi:hypothetical protein
MIMTYEEQRKRQIVVEIEWLKNKLANCLLAYYVLFNIYSYEKKEI